MESTQLTRKSDLNRLTSMIHSGSFDSHCTSGFACLRGATASAQFLPVSTLWLLACVSCLFSPGCGYQVAGRGDRLPADVQTIAVPMFVNETSRFKIEQLLTSAVTRELIERTKFRVTPEPGRADAILKGTVKDVRAGVVTFDLNTGRATTLQIQVTSSVTLLDRHTNKVLFANLNYVFRGEYQASQNSANVFEEDQAALDRLSGDLARTLVTDVLENF
jgi:hypothetical protein